jgi:hypothetical protein
MKTFEGFFDYLKFVVLVKNTNRYRFYPWGEKFLETLLFTCESRKFVVQKGTFFWRSQLGKAEPRKVVWEEGVYDDHKPFPYAADRMKPRIGMAPEGRVNPKGIPYLYLSTDRDTAMSECRPWLQSDISVGRFQTARDLSLVDFTKDTYTPVTISDLPKKKTDPKFIEKVIWGQINEAFMEPVQRSDQTADYSPTQVIAEFLKSKEFDGIKYKSAFGEGHNIALFDLHSVEMTHCWLYCAKRISYLFEPVQDAYYATPLGEYLDDPQAAEDFLNRVKKITQGNSNREDNDKT